MSTRHHNSYISDACWSPTRPGLFFVTRKDGWLDIWDFYYRQNEVALSHKVSDKALTCIKLNNVTTTSQVGGVQPDIGKYCAIGDSSETITLLKLCKSLYRPQADERTVVNEIFERERFREDMLRKQKKEISGRERINKEVNDLSKSKLKLNNKRS